VIALPPPEAGAEKDTNTCVSPAAAVPMMGAPGVCDIALLAAPAKADAQMNCRIFPANFMGSRTSRMAPFLWRCCVGKSATDHAAKTVRENADKWKTYKLSWHQPCEARDATIFMDYNETLTQRSYDRSEKPHIAFIAVYVDDLQDMKNLVGIWHSTSQHKISKNAIWRRSQA
jgi:hypothetical protein